MENSHMDTETASTLGALIERIGHDLAVLVETDSNLPVIWLRAFMQNDLARVAESPLTLREAGLRTDGFARVFETCSAFEIYEGFFHGIHLLMMLVETYVVAVYTETQRASPERGETILGLAMQRLREARRLANEKIETILKERGIVWRRKRYERRFALTINRDPLNRTEMQEAILTNETGEEIQHVLLSHLGIESRYGWTNVRDTHSTTTGSMVTVVFVATHHEPFTVAVYTKDSPGKKSRIDRTEHAHPIDNEPATC